MPSSKQKSLALGIAILLLFPAASLLLVQDQIKTDMRAPTENNSRSEWLELIEMSKENLRDGDLLRIIPFWDTTPRILLRGSVKGSHSWPFSALDWRTPADPIPWMSFRRVVRLGWKNKIEEELENHKPESSKSILIGETEKLVAYATPLPQSPLKWRAMDHLEKASVERTLRSGAIESCDWSRDHHKCPGASNWWQEIRNLRVDAGDLPRECIFVQPHPNGSRAEVTFHRVELGPGDTVVLRAGNTIQGTRQDRGSNLSIELRIDDVIIVRDTYHKNDYTFVPWAVRFPEESSEGSYQITVSLSAENSSWRQGCFDLHVLREGWEAWGEIGYGAPFTESPGPVPVRWYSWPSRILSEGRGLQ